MNSEVGLWMEGATPSSDQSSDLAFAVHCDERTLSRKFAVLQAHSSQTTELVRVLGTERYRQWWSTEIFVGVTWSSPRTHLEREPLMINHDLHIALAAERRRTLLTDAHAHRLCREARPAAWRSRVRHSRRSVLGRRVRPLNCQPVPPALTGCRDDWLVSHRGDK